MARSTASRSGPATGVTRASPGRGAVLARGLDDLRSAGRSLRRDRAFTFTVVTVLGAGIALHATVFAVVNAYLLRPLPYPEPDRLVTVRAAVPIGWPELDHVFETRVAWDLGAFTLVGDEGPEMVLGAWITADFLETYGIDPVLGRRFSVDESARGAHVALVGHRVWQRRFGGDPAVIGRTFRAYTSERPSDAESYTIVGVLPSGFWHFNDYTDVLVPLETSGDLSAGRLREGIPLAHAERLVTDAAGASLANVPTDFRVRLPRTRDLHVAPLRPTLVAFQSAVILVFLIALANTAVLQLVRSARRERELGIRRALGASASGLARQLIAEGAVLAAGAGAVGLTLGALGLDALRELSTGAMWRAVPGGAGAVRLDGTVVIAVISLGLVTAAVFALVPLLSVARRELVRSLADGPRGGTDTVGRRRARGAMVATEVALSLALLTGATLMVRSALALQGRALGFEPGRVFRGNLGLPQAGYPEADDRIAFFERVATSALSVPDVEAVAVGSSVPFVFSPDGRPIEAEGGRRADAAVVLADERYFDVLGLELLRGRGFAGTDVLGGNPVAIVTEGLAADLWPGLDPLGRRLRHRPFTTSISAGNEPGPWATVVGVSRDVWRGIGHEDVGAVFRVYRHDAPFFLNLIVRARAGVPPPIPEVRAAIGAVDPTVPLATVRDLEDAVAGALAPSRLMAAVLAAFAGFALLLSVVGLYGVVSYAARDGRRDTAIRMALGATAGSVTWLVLRRALLVVSAGLAAGAVGGRLLGAALAGQLHGIEPGDPVTAAAVAGLLGATALVAVWLPARGAAAASPMAVLRED